jgi:hypothetical protein
MTSKKINGTRIIGDSYQAKRFDPLLHEKISRQLAEEEIEERRRRLEAKLGKEDIAKGIKASRTTTPINKKGLLDIEPFSDHEYGMPYCTNRNEFIEMYNLNDKIMASAADYYAAAKSGRKDVIDKLWRKNEMSSMKLCDIICSDQIIYKKHLEATIIRYSGSTVITPEEVNVTIPVCNLSKYCHNKTLDDVLDNDIGLRFVRTMFNTEDNAKKIEEVIETLTGYKGRDVKIWTPSEDARRTAYRKGIITLCTIKSASITSKVSYFFGISCGSNRPGNSYGVSVK